MEYKILTGATPAELEDKVNDLLNQRDGNGNAGWDIEGELVVVQFAGSPSSLAFYQVMTRDRF